MVLRGFVFGLRYIVRIDVGIGVFVSVILGRTFLNLYLVVK